MPAPAGSSQRARAYWTTAPGHGEIRSIELRSPGRGEALVATLASGISRGTELLVHRGGVPAGVAEVMRAPYQQGKLPGPVAYGYLSVGEVQDGPAELLGRRVFCLHPHQDRYVVPIAALTPVPDEVPTQRAVLAGIVETAVNALWDSGPLFGDRVAVVGVGTLGASVAGLLRRFPLERLQVVDPDPQRRAVAQALGVELVAPADAAGGCDLVLHCSATAAGLETSLRLLGFEGEVTELSWYGDQAPRVPLGESFHARRLSIRASQVSSVSPTRRARRAAGDRLELALRALADPAFDALLGCRTSFEELPTTMRRLAAGELGGGCPVVTYP